MQQQQQPAATAALPMSPMSAIPAANITTEQIQKYLDENKQLILAILDNQNLGKLAECAQYQAQLQKNLLYLAAIADAQPSAAAARPQMMPQGALPEGGQYMQQALIFPPRAPVQFSPHQIHAPPPPPQQQQLHPQTPGMPFPGQMGIRPGPVSGMQNMHPDPSHGGSSDLHAAPNMADFHRGAPRSSAVDVRGNKQDTSGGAASEIAASDGHRSSVTEHGSGNADQTKTP